MIEFLALSGMLFWAGTFVVLLFAVSSEIKERRNRDKFYSTFNVQQAQVHKKFHPQIPMHSCPVSTCKILRETKLYRG